MGNLADGGAWPPSCKAGVFSGHAAGRSIAGTISRAVQIRSRRAATRRRRHHGAASLTFAILARLVYRPGAFASLCSPYVFWSSAVTRESMEYDVVIVGAGPAGLAAPAGCASCRSDRSRCRSASSRRVPRSARTSSPARCSNRRALNELFPDWQALGAPLDTPVTEDEIYFLRQRGSGHQGAGLAGAEDDAQRGQLHRQPRQPLPLARPAGRKPRRGDLPRFRRRGDAYHEDGSVKGVATGDIGIWPRRRAQGQLQPGMELHAQVHAVRRRLSRPPRQAADQAIRPRRRPTDRRHYGIGIKELWEIQPEKHRKGW